MENRKLTPKQQAFADYYVVSMNGRDAATKAGYSKKTARTIASENLTKPNIKKYVGDKLKEIASSRIADATELLELFTSIARSEEHEEVVMSSVKGVEKVTKIPDIRDRQRAAEELLKRYTLGNNQQLKNELLEAQIKKVLKDIETESSTEDKMQEYFEKLDGAFNDET